MLQPLYTGTFLQILFCTWVAWVAGIGTINKKGLQVGLQIPKRGCIRGCKKAQKFERLKNGVAVL